MALIFKEKMHQ